MIIGDEKDVSLLLAKMNPAYNFEFLRNAALAIHNIIVRKNIAPPIVLKKVIELLSIRNMESAVSLELVRLLSRFPVDSFISPISELIPTLDPYIQGEVGLIVLQNGVESQGAWLQKLISDWRKIGLELRPTQKMLVERMSNF